MTPGVLVINLPASVAWRIGKATRTQASGDRLKTAQAEKVEIEISEKLRELVPINEVVTDVGTMLTAFRQKMLSLPGVLAPGLVNISNARTIERQIKGRVREALDEISRYDPA